jgi:hypothetical protein
MTPDLLNARPGQKKEMYCTVEYCSTRVGVQYCTGENTELRTLRISYLHVFKGIRGYSCNDKWLSDSAGFPSTRVHVFHRTNWECEIVVLRVPLD